jgi:hypothetical protein
MEKRGHSGYFSASMQMSGGVRLLLACHGGKGKERIKDGNG